MIAGAILLVLAASMHWASGAVQRSGLRLEEWKDAHGTKLTVRSRFYALSIRPRFGARVSSLLFGQPDLEDMTYWNPDATSGLLAEKLTEEAEFELTKKVQDKSRILLQFSADAGSITVRKEFEFHADKPWFGFRLVLENNLPYRLGGGEAPGMLNVVLPAGKGSPQRQLYCFDYGRGPWAMGPEQSLLKLPVIGAGRRTLRWVAVSDPVSRRALGFVFLDSSAHSLEAERTASGNTCLVWSHDPPPPASRVTYGMMVVPLEGFPAVSSLTPAFAADSTVTAEPERGLGILLRLLPLQWPLREVSIISRAYDARGRELRPCDSALADSIEAGRLHVARTRWRGEDPGPAWFVHEVYSEGKKAGEFSLDLTGAARLPTELPKPDPPLVEKLPGAEEPPDRALVEPGEPAAERGFIASLFQGRPEEEELESLHLVLGAGETETLFLAVRATEAVDKFRASLTGTSGDPAADSAPMPSSAAYLWTVKQPQAPEARMELFEPQPLKRDEVLWLALTVDASELQAGTYSARLILEAGSAAQEVPLRVEATSVSLPACGGFGLWYLDGGLSAGQTNSAVLSKLRAYRVSGLTLSTAQMPQTADAARRAARADMDMIALRAAGRAQSPDQLQALAGCLESTMLPAGRAAWVLGRLGAGDERYGELKALGVMPAAVFRRLPLPRAVEQKGPPGPVHWLVEDEVDLAAVSALLDNGRMDEHDMVWRLVDLHGTDWRGEALRLREKLWTAAWEGLAGAAVNCPVPLEPVDQQLVIWHVLRDAWEEAAYFVAERRIDAVLDASAKPDEAEQDGIELLSTSGILKPVREKKGSRSVMRMEASEPGCLRPYWHMKHAILKARHQLSGAGERGWENLYWRGIPLMEAPRYADALATESRELRWDIVCAEESGLRDGAEALQAAIRQRTGRTVPISAVFPTAAATPLASAGLIWVFAQGEELEQMPPKVQTLADRKEEGFTLGRIDDGRQVVLVREAACVKQLAGMFHRYRTLYGTAGQMQ